jgi:hypothetical protein
MHQIQYVFWNGLCGFDSFGFWDEVREIALEQINSWDGLLKCLTASPYQWTSTQYYINRCLPSI